MTCASAFLIGPYAKTRRSGRHRSGANHRNKKHKAGVPDRSTGLQAGEAANGPTVLESHTVIVLQGSQKACARPIDADSVRVVIALGAPCTARRTSGSGSRYRTSSRPGVFVYLTSC